MMSTKMAVVGVLGGVLLVGALVWSVGCEGTFSCTEIGCIDGFVVEFRRGDWSAGDYEVEVTLDGVTTLCSVTLPFDSCEIPDPCLGPTEIQLGLSGCALPDNQHSIPEVHILTTPELVEIRVSQDGTEIGSGEFAPDYEQVMPNGPRCEPTCNVATTRTIAIAEP